MEAEQCELFEEVYADANVHLVILCGNGFHFKTSKNFFIFVKELFFIYSTINLDLNRKKCSK